MATSAVALLTVSTGVRKAPRASGAFEIRMTKDVALGFQPVWTVSTRAKEMDAVIAFLDDAALSN